LSLPIVTFRIQSFNQPYSSSFNKNFTMLFKSLLSAALLCGTAFSSVIDKRDSKPITDALASISSAIKELNAGVTGWNGDGAAAALLLVKAEDLNGVITKATSSINPIPVLPLTEAVQILAPGNALITDVQGVIDSLVAKKDGLVKQNLGVVVGETLARLKVGAQALIEAITTKLPANVQSVGGSIGKQINAALDKGVTAFKA
jgi:hypothetical protein